MHVVFAVYSDVFFMCRGGVACYWEAIFDCIICQFVFCYGDDIWWVFEMSEVFFKEREFAWQRADVRVVE